MVSGWTGVGSVVAVPESILIVGSGVAMAASGSVSMMALPESGLTSGISGPASGAFCEGISGMAGIDASGILTSSGWFP